WPAPAGLVAVAPLLLGEGRFAFGLQAPGPQLPAELAAPSRLKVLGPGGEEREIPLPFKLHQLLAADPARKHLLALSLGIEDAQPTLLWVSLETGQVENLGFEPALYQAALTRPGHREAALAWESNYGAEGWLISLFGPEGKLLRNLVERPNRQDLAPAWSPEGAELAFLAETPPEKAPPP
ncbi:MAG TPA: hypothetical protein PK413_17330, partial [Thermoanaerobaculia bacterium]|nr:hypothetical protein [Thermoanaerobaculia bacterium]